MTYKRPFPPQKDEDGRPVQRRASLGPLHELLLRCAPPGKTRGGRDCLPSLPTLARALGIHHVTPYWWIGKNWIPANRVNDLVRISEGRVEQHEFFPYVFQSTDA